MSGFFIRLNKEWSSKSRISPFSWRNTPHKIRGINSWKEWQKWVISTITVSKQRKRVRIWHGSLLGMTGANPTWSILHKNLISFAQLSIKLKMRRIHLKKSKHKYLQRIWFTYILVLSHFNPFLACGLFLQPLKTSDFFQGLLKKTSGMKWVKLKPEKIS